jgi:hypothetical protein
MGCDQPTPPIQVLDSLNSHESLDFEFPSKEAILDAMASIDKTKEDEHHIESILPSLKLMRVDMIGLDQRLEAFDGTPNETPRTDPFLPRLYFSELATELSTSPSIEDSNFVLVSCLYGAHQGAFVAHKTTHGEYLQL